MQGVAKVVLAVMLSLSLTSCGAIRRHLESAEIVNVREQMFASQPLWESNEIRAVRRVSAKVSGKTPQDLLTVLDERPGLSMIVRQVFAEDLAAAGARQAVAAPSSTRVTADSAPLPNDVAKQRVMKVIAGTMWDQEVAAQGVPMAASALAPSIPKRLSLVDFKNFGEAVAVNLVRPYQTVGGVQTSTAPDVRNCKDKLTFGCLFTAYMTAYFNGSFVDRNGGTYTKPKVGMTITNEVISGAVSIFLEAVFDFSIIDGTSGAAPIVYTEDRSTSPSRAKWLTKDNKAPTLAEVILAIGKRDPGNPSLPLLEKVVENDKDGRMDARRLCVVRMLGGAAGDAAQPVTGMIVRGFGGANVGFTFGLGALGKFSFGDNETLAKLVDTVVENLPRRTTEIAVENALYNNVPSSGGLGSALEIASWLGNCR